MTGDCTEHTFLAVALFRAAGLPAKPVLGLAQSPAGKYAFHAWARVYVDGWIDVDPSFNTIGVDASHISFYSGNMDSKKFNTVLMNVMATLTRIQSLQAVSYTKNGREIFLKTKKDSEKTETGGIINIKDFRVKLLLGPDWQAQKSGQLPSTMLKLFLHQKTGEMLTLAQLPAAYAASLQPEMLSGLIRMQLSQLGSGLKISKLTTANRPKKGAQTCTFSGKHQGAPFSGVIFLYRHNGTLQFCTYTSRSKLNPERLTFIANNIMPY